MRVCGFILLASFLCACGSSSGLTDSGTDPGTDDGVGPGEEIAGVDAGDTGLADGAADGIGDPGSLCPGGQPPALASLTADELHAALQTKDFLLINVAGAPSIPGTDTIISYSDTAALTAFIGADRQTKVVLYCQSGHRSDIAGQALVALGYCAVRQLTGGKTAWAAAGYPLE